MLKNERILLRGVEPGDVDYLFISENDTSLWKVSDTLIPFSRNTLKNYAESVHDLNAQGQFRFIIENRSSGKPIGMVDLYDFNPIHRRVGIGIVITDEASRKEGLATESIQLIVQYTREVLQLKQLFCSIHSSNTPSLCLFEKLGFVQVGERKDWFKTKDGWESELLYQLILI